MNESAEIIVQGLVQGVGYRWFAERKANELNLKGWVKNLDNGNVWLTVEGERRIIELFIEKLKTGPSISRVTHLQVQWLPYSGQLPAFYISH